jgi:S-(hydroxymethyl)glutathione dehydrogenase/alcohol dehydrogenase
VKAAVLETPGAALRVASDVQLPDLLPGQILVKLAFSGVCHSQLMETRGLRGDDRYVPHLLGHEGSGVVIECGHGVSKTRAADRVVLGWIKGEGLEGGPVRYSAAGSTINAGAVTTFNEYAVVSENRLVKLPDGVPLDVAVLFGCALPTGAGMVFNEIRPEPGSTIAVFGLGGIGMSALIASVVSACSRVIAVDVSEDKLALARAFGATDTINASVEDPVSTIRALTAGSGVDYAVEASGRTRVIEAAFSAVRRQGGSCVFASHPAHGERISLDPFELISGKQIRGSWGGGCKPDVDIPRMAQLYVEGKLPLEKLISRRYTLEQINDALDDLESGRVARPLIVLDPTLAD